MAPLVEGPTLLPLPSLRSIKEELNHAYLEEEIYWKQKSRVMWLRAGDRNTRYFHGIAKGKRVRNTINSIQDENGVTQRGQRSIAQVAESYFQQLYASAGDSQQLIEQAFQGYLPKVTPEMNSELTRAVTEEEVQRAIFDIGPHKAPGPDGFSAVFFHQHWDEIKGDIIAEVQRFFSHDEFDTAHNHTNICLIDRSRS